MKFRFPSRLFVLRGYVTQFMGGVWDHFRDHVFSVRYTFVLEADCTANFFQPAGPPVAFRTGTADDLHLFAGEQNGYGEKDRAFCMKRLRDGDIFLIGLLSGQPVFSAWLMVGQIDLDHNHLLPARRNIAYSYKLLTVDHVRGRGICGVYYGFLRQHVLAQGCTRLVCRVAPGNTGSLRAHFRAGFIPVGVLWQFVVWNRTFFLANRPLRIWLQSARAPGASISRGVVIIASRTYS